MTQVTGPTPVAATLVSIRGLTARTAQRVIVDDIDLDIPADGVTALVGASGSGKTTTAMALMGEHRPGVQLSWRERSAAQLRFGYVPQHPSAVLNPALRIGTVLRDVEHAARRRGADVSVGDALRRSGFSDDPAMLRRHPHQLSGGQQQRLVIALALLTAPDCLVMDEPTTGQDPARRDAVLTEIERLVGLGLPVLLLTHDHDAVRRVASHVITMEHGRIVAVADRQPTGRDENSGRQRHRIAACDVVERGVARLALESISAGYRRHPVLQDFSLRVEPGECVALVGASGSGKSTAARVLAGLQAPSAGRVLLDGRPLPDVVSRRSRTDAAAIGYVFQDAKAAFDPYRSVWDQIVRSPVRLRSAGRAQAQAAALRAIEQVGLSRALADSRPGTLSGGEAQRAAIARALSADPSVLICDEVTTGLDPESQRQVLHVMSRLTRDEGRSLLIITHDQKAVAQVADRVVDLDHPGQRA
ncbi:ABC transporter ATP-binding protein [Gordonia tangerina]|uniref:ATP-binding cassette domain-containing protein n=1 Tax=Gordonia tangerina TaxID=2911060 RepID=A0ABS9DJH3_9ACTN|nr:ATP-binding cassette domain-containing protein [Gordonia tangerina]MCF3939306.1 ATP-binding cassette domain-containing protein [Gordonia tangerina]